ncbi:hypothetical protein D9758_018591 [Tetrapyrgos nigripes]|uniref:Uncharacterized protein n=1 Tax=Tetrapyrgos nigripes TaxID=182062 RepID=A0A8H5EZG1_9AGAR|nr:hypothetical protein D9758_018591 [Tetrapyrgos nigripes]
MGKAEDWQTKLTNALSTRLSSSSSSQPQHLTILNPRRQSWDSPGSRHLQPEFRTQVEWELDAQDNADVIAMFFPSRDDCAYKSFRVGVVCGEWEDVFVVRRGIIGGVMCRLCVQSMGLRWSGVWRS